MEYLFSGRHAAPCRPMISARIGAAHARLGEIHPVLGLVKADPFFLSVHTPCFPFRAEKFPRCEHPEIIDSLAKERSKIPAIQREKHIGSRERCAEDRLVLCDLKKQRPIKSQFVILDNEPALEITPSTGCRRRQTSQILAHFPHHPRGNHQLPNLRSREFENEPRRTRF